MKKVLRSIVVKILWWQVGRLQRAHQFSVIGVAGSVGKTSTKVAVASVLSTQFKVAWQEGNYNDVVSIPLVFFGQPMPSLLNPIAWIRLFVRNETSIRQYDKQIVVVELGTDHAGDMAQLKGRLTTDVTILTAITPEHMAGFDSLDDVAAEELIAAEIAKHVVADSDSIPEQYLSKISNPTTIGMKAGDCIIDPGELHMTGRAVRLQFEGEEVEFTTPLLGKHNLPAPAFAFVVARQQGIETGRIQSELQKLRAFPGRMNTLPGKHGALLIDDTYNSSPDAATAALDTLYELQTTRRIAVLGQMNELGKFSEAFHTELGEHCNPDMLELVLTIGEDANKYTASAAEAKGCKVIQCASPYQAAAEIEPLLSKETVVLIKGSQNGVFAEETTKQLLANKADTAQLVRQSDHWLRVKQQQFKDS
jgi:UDP-N-acetylmuramoyl-tripeptide--D-alanyl-D-alanine ligase